MTFRREVISHESRLVSSFISFVIFLVCAMDERCFFFDLNCECLDVFHLSQCAVSVAAFAFSPIKDGLQQLGEGARFQFLGSFLQCVFCLERRMLCLPRHLRGRCCAQKTDVPALVMRFCVRLLLNREATTPSSLNTVKTKKNGDKFMASVFVLASCSPEISQTRKSA